MIKNIYPIFSKCQVPSKAEIFKSGIWKLPLNIKTALHHGYIDVHGKKPPDQKNPFFDEYEELINNTSDDLLFNQPGIGNDTESRIGESRKLGRSFAKAILHDYYDYCWFSSIQNLLNEPKDNWSAKIKSKGDTPDWLIGKSDEAAIAEAKGTHSSLSLNSQDMKKWRKQVTNINIYKNENKKSLKTWIIASRFVIGNKILTPTTIIEDPILEGELLSEFEKKSLIFYIAKSHIINYLNLLGQHRLILRLTGILENSQEEIVWECLHPGLAGKRFVGNKSYYPLDIDKLISNSYISDFPRFISLELLRYLEIFTNAIGYNGIFMGMEISPIKSILKNEIPDIINAANLNTYPFLNMLKDGSFICPLDLMRPIEKFSF